MTMSLFDGLEDIEPGEETLGPGATILRDFAVTDEAEILSDINSVASQAPFCHMITPGGFRMSVAMTNSVPLCWASDRKGYRYDPIDS